MCSGEPRTRNLVLFGCALGVMIALNLVLGYLPVHPALLVPLGIVVALLFIGIPVLSLFKAADYPWTAKLAWAFVVVGALAHFGLGIPAKQGVFGVGFGSAIANAVAQAGLVTWSAGLGAFLSTMLKDRNLLLPVSLFLAAFDMFLVLTPVGFTRRLMEAQPALLPTIGLAIPKVQSHPVFGAVPATAYVGPADLLFMGMFFVALHRFEMRPAATFRALVPTLAVYLAVVLFVGPLPALVPIGLCVLIVNWKCFSLNKEEWISTGVVALIGASAVIWGATRPAPPAAPSIPESAQGVPTPPDSLGPQPQGSGR